MHQACNLQFHFGVVQTCNGAQTASNENIIIAGHEGALDCAVILGMGATTDGSTNVPEQCPMDAAGMCMDNAAMSAIFSMEDDDICCCSVLSTQPPGTPTSACVGHTGVCMPGTQTCRPLRRHPCSCLPALRWPHTTHSKAPLYFSAAAALHSSQPIHADSTCTTVSGQTVPRDLPAATAPV